MWVGRGGRFGGLVYDQMVEIRTKIVNCDYELVFFDAVI